METLRLKLDKHSLVTRTAPEVARSFWKTSVADLTAVPIKGLAIPLAHTGTRVQTTSTLSSNDQIKVQGFAKTLDGASKGLALAAWTLTLSAHSGAGSKAMAFGVAECPRHSMSTMYPLKVPHPSTKSIRSWVYNIAAISSMYSDHAFIGYDEICGYASDFSPQTMLVFGNGARPPTAKPQPPIIISVDSSTWAISADHDAAIPQAKISILLDHMKYGMLYISTTPTANFEGLDLVSPAERATLLKFGKATLPPFQGLIHELIEEQARTKPDTPAVQFEGDAPMTYWELNKRANAVARQLVCGRGTYVPVCVSRSVNLVIAILAILKTGAAYVLLSDDTPLERNRFIMKDVQAPFIITDVTTRGKFPKEAHIEDLVAKIDLYDCCDLNTYQVPSDIAYVIYTSGTTGTPKGVLLDHGAAYSGLCALPAQKDLRQLLCHNPVFSAAQRTIFGTLKRGGTLCLASKENLTVHLQDTIKQMQISSLEITPSMAALIDPSTVSKGLCQITLGGESISPALVQKWANKLKLVNAYGLSENTQMNWRHTINPGENPNILGRPTDSTLSYVLVPGTVNLSPLLVPGELCLGGSQLAREYLNQDEKTKEAFVDNPFGPGRIYRTGDCVICHEDGRIELIGRIDQQTKIDGQRVEPAESNALIQKHPLITESCTVSAFVLGRKALVAVVIPREGVEWSSLWPELRASLRAQLPSFAVPSYWVRRNELPRNLNGKTDIALVIKTVEGLDERDLLSLPRTGPTSVNRTDTEDAVLKAIALKKSIPPTIIDLEASFQDLGGSSLDAIHVAAQLRQDGFSVTVGSILQANSLREIAAGSKPVVSKELASPTPFSLVPSTFKHGNAEDAYPATPLQEGVVGDSLLGKADHIYTRVYSIRASSLSEIRAAFVSVIKRSTILRTTFIPYKRNLIQIVNKSIDLPWEEVRGDLQSFLMSPRKDRISVLGPLLQATVLNGDTLIVDIHHALFDFWSSRFVFDDVNSTLLGQDPVVRAPFSAYVRYQKEQHNERTTAFWEEYLKGAAPLELKLNGTSDKKSKVGKAGFTISSNVEVDLSSNSLSHGITVGALAHAVWALILSICHRTDDVLFAAAFSGRDAEVDGILALDGPTLCVVPMRIGLDQSLTVLDFVRNVQTNHLWRLSKYAHYGMRSALQAGGLAADSFNSMVNVLVKTSETSSAEPPLVPIPQDAPNFTQYITIELDESKPGLIRLLVPFAANNQAAQSLVDTFARILEMMVENPTTLVGEVLEEFQPIHDKSQSIIELKQKRKSPAQHGLAHLSFEAMSAAHPSKTALKSKDGAALTYGDLNAKANSFAVWLHQKGLQPGEMVPLYMEKSLWTLIAIFGILKAGMSFTPLDPGNPHDRNAFIIKDVEARLVLTDRSNHDTCKGFGVETVVVQALNLSANTTEAPHVPEMTSESVIYAIYTSGSTGLPKGVLVQHSAVVAATEGMIEATGTDASWVSLWVLNYVFDASYYDVFTVLSAGGTLCLAPQDELLSDLTGAINSLEITQVMLTPTITKLITGGSRSVPTLRVLNVCGEKIDTNILEWAKSVDVYNGYGPTEATILMTVSKVLPDSSLNSIGFPLKHVTALIYQIDHVEQVPRGSIGELCVRGPQLAKGYLKRPEQTAAAFIRDENGELLYRTGDLARWHEDGHLECFGRKDYQLGEIENAILCTGDVDGCVVAAAEIQHKSQLVAFCIFAGEHRSAKDAVLLSANGVQRVPELLHKLTTLSPYMIPAIWLPFSSFPTLPSGKTNRKKLVALVEGMERSELSAYLQLNQSSGNSRPVETEEERIMSKCWAMVLDEPEDSIQATTDFVSLGGDSISAINVVAASRNLGWSITVSNVLSNPTLAEQAKHLTPSAQQEPVHNIVYGISDSVYDSLRDVGLNVDEDVEDISPCGPGQIEFLTQGHNTPKQYWQLTVCRPLAVGFDVESWLMATNELTARNQILRTTYIKSDPLDPLSWIQVVLKDPALDWEQIHYTAEDEKQGLMEALRDEYFEFGKPAVKYRLLTSSRDGSHILCIKLHHASYDGTLLRIFDEQFAALVRGDHQLEPPTEFRTFIDWNQRSDRKRALSYWTQHLDGYEPIRTLPRRKTQHGDVTFAKINGDLSSLTLHSGVTASTIFQAAYTVLVGRLSGRNDVLVDNLLTGRNAQVPNPQLINGTCANFLPFRSRFDVNSPLKKLLQETQSLFWDTTEHGTVGLGDIYNALGQNRDEYSARMLYCFQPFEPASGPQGQMRWIVMAMSKVMMNINYVIFLEVQKTLTGHRVKMQYDADVLSAVQADAVLELYNQILDTMVAVPDGTIGRLFDPPSSLDHIWEDLSPQVR